MRNDNNRDYCERCEGVILYPHKECPHCGFLSPQQVKKSLLNYIFPKKVTDKSQEFQGIETEEELTYPHCSKKIEKTLKSKDISNKYQSGNNISPLFSIAGIFLLMLMILLFKSGDVIGNLQNLTLSVPDCSDDMTKTKVIQVFIENNSDYRRLREDSIGSIYIENARTESYDKEAKKYICRGDVILKPKETGFYFQSYVSKRYYPISSHTYRCSVEYTSQLADEHRHYVESSYESSFGEPLACSFWPRI